MTGPTLEELFADVSAAALMRHVTEFARWTKFAGSAEEIESLQFVKAELESYGFSTELILHDAYISLPGAARVQWDNRTLGCITHSFSRPSAPGGTQGELVDVGAGSEQDFARHDLRGKIALIAGLAMPPAARRASLAGAIGHVHVSPDEHLHEMCISPVWGSPSDETVDQLPAAVAVSISAAAGAALKAAITAGGVTLTLHAEVDTAWRRTPILIADMASPNPGADEPFVLFSGHHDTWYYGVMDNGGANATMLEVARICALHRDAWQRGLRLAVWSGHSQGRYSGSAWYADARWEELERRCVAHVNIDSTGGRGNTEIADTTAASELFGLAREALLRHAGQEFAGRRVGRAGDESFWGIGIPAMFGNMGTQPPEAGPANRLAFGTGWWWHTRDDTLDKIDEAILVRDTHIFLHAVWRLLAETILPLDYAAHAETLLGELAKLPPSAVNVDLLVERAKTVREKATALTARAAGAKGAQAARINTALLAVSRALVPMDYTTGDRFAPDPAIFQSAWPPLDALRRLGTLPAGGDAARFTKVAAMRAHNRMAYALREAIAALDAGLTG